MKSQWSLAFISIENKSKECQNNLVLCYGCYSSPVNSWVLVFTLNVFGLAQFLICTKFIDKLCRHSLLYSLVYVA